MLQGGSRRRRLDGVPIRSIHPAAATLSVPQTIRPTRRMAKPIVPDECRCPALPCGQGPPRWSRPPGLAGGHGCAAWPPTRRRNFANQSLDVVIPSVISPRGHRTPVVLGSSDDPVSPDLTNPDGARPPSRRAVMNGTCGPVTPTSAAAAGGATSQAASDPSSVTCAGRGQLPCAACERRPSSDAPR
jgi:hypothetical protein